MASENRKGLTYRVRGIPPSVDIEALQKGLELLFETQDLQVDSLVPTSIGRQGQVATIRVANAEKLPSTQDQWRFPLSSTLLADSKDKHSLTFDTHFQGFTLLYSLASDTENSVE